MQEANKGLTELLDLTIDLESRPRVGVPTLNLWI